ncbi:WGR domain-containing protein (plasmid) [Sinorhizobium mexicanum]|uniref:WGR domain-containing protein n=3 Tax=Sinorhizobium mexicanum TaxID=375549 RepID=A0A859R2K8_9HYPH|nr:WGR domain-containing protein [Sinorhizobium mexicanum]QLL63888.1 WGR domain-containing protein [Sinorhizobium mexicanum]
MIAQHYHLYAERLGSSKNMARFCAMEVTTTLFGEACLNRSWGRIGKRGQSINHHFEREEEAVDLFLILTRRKLAKGYQPRSHRQS